MRSRSRSRGSVNVALAAQPSNNLETALMTSLNDDGFRPSNAEVHFETAGTVGLAEETIAEKPLRVRLLKNSDIPNLHK